MVVRWRKRNIPYLYTSIKNFGIIRKNICEPLKILWSKSYYVFEVFCTLGEKKLKSEREPSIQKILKFMLKYPQKK